VVHHRGASAPERRQRALTVLAVASRHVLATAATSIATALRGEVRWRRRARVSRSASR